jgi:excinuclease UvrABC ATPase subunit
MAHADWIIDLGPGAGHDGGRIVFEGTPAAIIADRSTLTGQHLAEYVQA